MRTVEKALKILDLFSIHQPEAGLSEIARQAHLDKATTLRMLSALVRQGFVEQHPESKKYRLGKAVLKLARVRETSFPVVALLQPVLKKLATLTGETAHASLATATALMTVGVAEPQRATRVFVDPSQPLPFHATASGICYLAFAPEGVAEEILESWSLKAYTETTRTTANGLRAEIETARQQGFAVAEGSFESDVIGCAAPMFDWSGHASGAIAVATVAARATAEHRAAIASSVLRAAVEVTRATGAEPAPVLLKAMGESATA